MSRLLNKSFKSYVLLSTTFSAAFILLIILSLAFSGLASLPEAGPTLFSTKWNPYAGQYGLLSMFYGTMTVSCLALLIATPLGIFSAIYISEFMNKRLKIYAKSLLELLAGIPSVIYGLIGVAFLGIWIGDLFSLSSGRTILTAGLLLAFMILPTIITLTDDALQNIPDAYRHSASSLGLYKSEVIKRVLLPMARSNIAGAVLLATGRALGETMAVMLVIGSIDRIPDPVYNILVPGQTVTSKLGREITETAFGSVHFNALIFMGLCLMLLVLLLTLLSQNFFKTSESRRYE